MAFTPTYGSVFCYGAAHAADRVRLSGPSTNTPVSGDPWYGDSPLTDGNGTEYSGDDFGEPVDQWNATSQPNLDPIHSLGYPPGPVDAAFTPNESWLYGVPLENGTYTRVVQDRWRKIRVFNDPS